jgi:hypothetical protein
MLIPQKNTTQDVTKIMLEVCVTEIQTAACSLQNNGNHTSTTVILKKKKKKCGKLIICSSSVQVCQYPSTSLIFRSYHVQWSSSYVTSQAVFLTQIQHTCYHTYRRTDKLISEIQE